VWRYLLAWQITLILGLKSFLNYIIITWLTSILTEAGQSATQAGENQGDCKIATDIQGLVRRPLIGKLK
ncbi:MFS transporter, partial [Pseudoalteromonas sp. S326]